jgi:hypothetical protein
MAQGAGPRTLSVRTLVICYTMTDAHGTSTGGVQAEPEKRNLWSGGTRRDPPRLRPCSKRSSPRPTQGRFVADAAARRADSSGHGPAEESRPGRQLRVGRRQVDGSALGGSRRERRRQQRVGPPPTRGCAQHVPPAVSSNNRDSPGRGVHTAGHWVATSSLIEPGGSWPNGLPARPVSPGAARRGCCSRRRWRQRRKLMAQPPPS